MSDKLLCPFCNKPLQPTHRIEDEYFCENYDCPQTSITWVGTSSLWKAFADTKKKLDIAVDALKELKPQKAKGGGYWAVKSADAIKLINTTIKQITALEQKD